MPRHSIAYAARWGPDHLRDTRALVDFELTMLLVIGVRLYGSHPKDCPEPLSQRRLRYYVAGG
jgi:hypothetical protein